MLKNRKQKRSNFQNKKSYRITSEHEIEEGENGDGDSDRRPVDQGDEWLLVVDVSLHVGLHHSPRHFCRLSDFFLSCSGQSSEIAQIVARTIVFAGA